MLLYQVERKYDEAFFFLQHISSSHMFDDAESVPTDDAYRRKDEEVGFYLSAFLSASASIFNYLHKASGTKGATTMREWWSKRPENKKSKGRNGPVDEVFAYFQKLRNFEVHQFEVHQGDTPGKLIPILLPPTRHLVRIPDDSGNVAYRAWSRHYLPDFPHVEDVIDEERGDALLVLACLEYVHRLRHLIDAAEHQLMLSDTRHQHVPPI
jgi:hypothetical protein